MTQPPPVLPRPYWTAGKIVALVLAVILIVGVSGFAIINYRNSGTTSTSGSSNTCANGATNPPACTTFPPCNNGATNPPTCTTFPTCSNGATNYPQCTSFPPCSNGATNPPQCNIFPTCSNGATNYPQCTTFNTSTSLGCTPSTMRVNLTQSTCIVTVSSMTIPTGSIGISCSPVSSSGFGECSYSPYPGCSLIGISSTAASCSFTIEATALTLTVYANYQGDNTHISSSGNFVFTVLPPPTSVTVTGTASTTGLGTTAVEIDFLNTSTGLTYSAIVSSGSYTINLSNFQTYNVVLHWNGAFGSSGTCNAGTLVLHSYADTWYANYQC